MDNNGKREFGEDYFQDEKEIKRETDTFGNSTGGSYEYTSHNEREAYYDNPYGGPAGGQNRDYRDYGQNEKKLGMGIASLVLGIISLVFFCSCCNVITGVLAIIFGIIQLVKYKPHGKGLAIGGIVTAVLSIVFLLIFWVVVGSNTALQNSILDEYKEIYDLDLRDPEDLEKFLEEYGNDDGESLDDVSVDEYGTPL